METEEIRIGDELPPGRRGMPVIVALGGFVILVSAFMAVAIGLIAGVRLLDRMF